MAKIKFITDSACDIPKEITEKYGIEVMPFKVAMGDKSYVSGVDFDNEKFYKMMDEYDGLPTTSQITTFEYSEVFKKYFDEGYTDIINVTINANGSATFNNAVMATNQFFDENPQAKGRFKIYNIDGKSYSGAYGYPIIQGAIKAEKGMSPQEIADYITDWVENCVIYFAPYSLKYAKKSGRIPSAAAFVGEVMGLRPIMRIFGGKIVTQTKVRGDKQIVPKILDLTINDMIPQTPYSIVYGNDDGVRDEMAEAMTKKLGYPPSDSFQICPAIAVNSGPKVTGVIFKAQNVQK